MFSIGIISFALNSCTHNGSGLRSKQQVKIIFHQELGVAGTQYLKDTKYNIAIFDTFKTRKDKFTGEAKRQRGIIAHLASEQSPELRTRTSIAHVIANKNGILWQNIYSGIFRDLDEVLIPSGVVKEGGRLPLRRGPRALQLEGVPFYELTDAGLLVASSIEELGKEHRTKSLEAFIGSLKPVSNEEKILYDGILLLMNIAPYFISKIINEYIHSYSIGVVDSVIPINVKTFKSVISNHIRVERQLLNAFVNSNKDQQTLIMDFIRILT